VDRRSGRRTNTILVSGSIPFDGTTQIYYRSITEPWRYLATALAEELRRQGVVLRGRLREGVVPQGAEEILVFESKPLARIVQDLNKMSNNFVAEMILKTMGAQVFGPPGTFDKGLSVVRRELSSMGLRPGTYQLVDGSGLSESNRLSPRQLTTVLKAMWQDFSLRPEYVVSLAVMGLDGSVEERLAQSPARQRLRVKTGHLKGVSALSGYAVAADGIELAFSILVNNSTCGRRQMERIQDQAALIITGTPASRKEKP
jgi:D-alanyl-D-alanine carboxypeptidase/D-alanyl-D-alanine-endopeptidase (penicillin-binding protein 4)